MYYKSKQLAKALTELDRDKPGQEAKIVEDFIKFCKNKKIIQQLPNILGKLELEGEKLAELKKCYIMVSQTLPKETIKQIKERVKIAPETETEIIEEAAIHGGFIARHEGIIYDGSVRMQLERLKNNLNAQ